MTPEHQRLTPQQEMERGRQASEVLEHPLYLEAFKVMRDRISRQWVESPARDTEGREKLWLMQKLLENVDQHLKELMQTGQLARLKLEQDQTLKEKAWEWMRNW